MKKFLLSIDQGTTSCRAIIFDTNGQTLAVSQREFKQIFPQPGYVEHDAEEILASQIFCIKEVVASAGIEPGQIAACGITNQRETTVVWDKTTGKPIYNAIVWQCRRTKELADKLRATHLQVIREKTGLVPDAYFSGPKISWILNHVPGAMQKAQEGKLCFGTIDSWLIWNLTNEQKHLTEVSNASRTMLFNINTLDWDDELLKEMAIPRVILPQVLPSNADFGTTSEKLLGFSAPILATLGDQQAALFGQACLEEGMAKCTYGTGGFLLANIGNKVQQASGLLTTIAWQEEGAKAVYAFEGAIFVAGAAIQWLRDGLGILESSAQTESLALSLESNEGVYFVPALTGLGSPWWDSDVRGTIVGLTRGSGRAHLTRAALEAMAYQISDVVQDMKKNGIELKELRVDGGAAANNFMVQFQADLLGVPVLRAKQLESTAWGVAAMAGLKCGLLPSKEKFAQNWQYDLKISPQQKRDSDYQGWQKALKGAFACAHA
jgi:glycerol kinase